MPSSNVLAAQLTACRMYLANSLGHIPEVRKLLSDIDSALKTEAEPELRGAVYSPVGVLMIEVAIHGDQAFVSTGVRPDFKLVADLVANLNAGISVTLKRTF